MHVSADQIPALDAQWGAIIMAKPLLAQGENGVLTKLLSSSSLKRMQ
jgi:hypothetical protein